MKSIKNEDVYVRTSMGSEEVRSMSESVLPREARTLLILLDGRKTFGQVANSLESRKMYIDAGGVTQYLELLLDLEFAELKENEDTHSPLEKPSVSLNSAEAQATGSRASEQSKPEITLYTRANEKVVDFESKSQVRPTPVSALRSQPQEDLSFEKLRAQIASLIEKYTEAQESWSYLLRLEECRDQRELLALIQKIQRSSGGKLEKALGQAAKTIRKTAS